MAEALYKGTNTYQVCVVRVIAGLSTVGRVILGSTVIRLVEIAVIGARVRPNDVTNVTPPFCRERVPSGTGPVSSVGKRVRLVLPSSGSPRPMHW